MNGTATGALLVTFCHGDEDDQEEIARTGKHAAEIARRMLADCAELYDGDLLSISRYRLVRGSLTRVRQTDG